MENPVTPQKSPYKIKAEKDKTYFWCSCGLSQKQPFCDGTHKKDKIFKSVRCVFSSDEVIFFCGCKKTKRPPYCDGSHAKL